MLVRTITDPRDEGVRFCLYQKMRVTMGLYL